MVFGNGSRRYVLAPKRAVKPKNVMEAYFDRVVCMYLHLRVLYVRSTHVLNPVYVCLYFVSTVHYASHQTYHPGRHICAVSYGVRTWMCTDTSMYTTLHSRSSMQARFGKVRPRHTSPRWMAKAWGGCEKDSALQWPPLQDRNIRA